jgi:hypothetical protein
MVHVLQTQTARKTFASAGIPLSAISAPAVLSAKRIFYCLNRRTMNPPVGWGT